MDEVFEDWPWAEPNIHLDPASDLLDDLTLPQSYKSCHLEQQSFDWDGDLFAQLDDFILFPDTVRLSWMLYLCLQHEGTCIFSDSSRCVIL